MGYYDIPFNFNCPNCESIISGKVKVDENDLDITNANVAEASDWGEYYTVELSAEFPTKKVYMREKKDIGETPFMRNLAFHSEAMTAHEATRNAMVFANYSKTNISRLLSYFELLRNKKYSILFPKIEEEVANYSYIPIKKINNEHDAEMALHQILLTSTGLSFALEPNSLENYSKIGQSIISDIPEQSLKYGKESSENFVLFEKKFLKLLEYFSKIYDQLIPVVSLRNTGSLDRLDKETFGIMTTNFGELTDFYAKSYELILDNLDIAIALNNIKYRGNYDNCIGGKSLSDLPKLPSKFKKIDFLDDSELFSKPTSCLKNTIRNSIQHFDSEIDYVSQRIIFTDTFKGRTRQNEMYLIDLAVLCLENFSLLLYFQELVYILKKFLYLDKGVIPTIISDMKTPKIRASRKIPRNSPCPCGSGKKYKKCCGF